MDAFTLEISVHRVGGADELQPGRWRFARSFGPWITSIHPDRYNMVDVPGPTSSQMVWLEFEPFTVVRPGLLSASVTLYSSTQMRYGPSRPVLVSTLPCDVPLYSAHIANDPQVGVFSVGLRSTARAWTPEHLEHASVAPDAVV